MPVILPEFLQVVLLQHLFIYYKIVHEVLDRHRPTVRTMKTVKAALNTGTKHNIVYKITPHWRQ